MVWRKKYSRILLENGGQATCIYEMWMEVAILLQVWWQHHHPAAPTWVDVYASFIV